jgi:hypothetical protein
MFGVLRREQTSRDRGDATRSALRFLSSSTEGVRTDYIRLVAAGSSNPGAVLVPVTRYSLDPSGVPPEVRARLEKRDALCLFHPDSAGDGGAKACFTTDEVTRGLATGSLGLHFYGLVPDGVTRVTVRYRDGSSTTAPVLDNFSEVLATEEPGAPSQIAARPATIAWENDAGEQIGP